MLGVEPAVLEDGDGHTGPSSGLDDPKSLCGIRGQRLVDHHGDPGVDALPCLTGVNAAGRCEDDEVETVHRKQRIEVHNHPSAREVLADLLRASRICRGDRRDRHTGLL